MTNTPTSKYDGHTPGPWVLITKPKCTLIVGSLRTIRGERTNPVVCELHSNPELVKVNARLIADAPQILRERDEAREALAGLYMLFDRPGEDSCESFERVAESFHRDTGMLRPGKDQPAAMCGTPTREEREDGYKAWFDAKMNAAIAAQEQRKESAND